MTSLEQQFKEHDKNDVERFDKLEQLLTTHIERCDKVLCRLEPVSEALTWVNSTGKFIVWFKPIFISLVSIAGTWLIIKGWFK